MKNFVRGKGNYAPFLPGGLEPELAPGQRVEENGMEEEEEELEDEDEGWKTRAPGLRRGVKLSGGECLPKVMLEYADRTGCR